MHIFTSADNCCNNQEECCDLVVDFVTIGQCELKFGKTNLNPCLISLDLIFKGVIFPSSDL